MVAFDPRTDLGASAQKEVPLTADLLAELGREPSRREA